MILLIDNYDSFTYNLVQYLGELGADVHVRRNDEVTVESIQSMGPEKIVISPGPCTPDEAGVSVDVVKSLAGQVPILGVCLGHQSIGVAFGAKIVRAPEIMHGKISKIEHDGKGIFVGLENPFVATRYHSLVIDPGTVPTVLEISARTQDGIIMGVRHKEFAIEGLQFHPESILTEVGKGLIKNFLQGST